MPIGLFHSVMILADMRNKIALIAIFLLSHWACEHDLPLKGQDNANYICGKDCLSRYGKFKDKIIHLEVEPAGNLSQVFYNIDSNKLQQNPIVLNPSSIISGRAVGLESDLSERYPDEHQDKGVTFFDLVALPVVNENPLLAPRTSMVKTRVARDGSFQIELLKNVSYSLLMNASGQFDRAPIYVHRGLIKEDIALNFSLAKSNNTIKGKVVAEERDAINLLESSMQVRVMQGYRLISSVGLVKPDGQFSVEVAKAIVDNNLPITLLVEPNNLETALPKITKKLDKDQLYSDVEMHEINLGSLKNAINLTVEVRGNDDSVVSLASLFLNAKIGAGEVMLKKQVNASGLAQFLKLFEGSYDIAVVPPFDSKFGMRVIKDIELDFQENVDLLIDLQEREVLSAEIFGPHGKPVSGAQIEFSRIGEMGLFASEDIYDDMLFKLTAGSNDRGQVCHRKFGFETSNNDQCSNLLLDEGRYLAHIIPPAGTELAHKWITIDFPKERRLTIVLEQPEVLNGQILAPDQKSAVKRAFVTVYLAELSLHNQPKVIGKAITDEQGFFTAFVSAPR